MNPATRGIRIMIVAVVTALSLAACGATPYKTYSYWNGGGFTDTEVQPGLFLVRFMGNASTTPARTADLALLRAAEICLDRGKDYLLLGELATQYASERLHRWLHDHHDGGDRRPQCAAAGQREHVAADIVVQPEQRRRGGLRRGPGCGSLGCALPVALDPGKIRTELKASGRAGHKGSFASGTP